MSVSAGGGERRGGDTVPHFWVTHAVVLRPPHAPHAPTHPEKMLIWVQRPGLRPVWKTMKSRPLMEREALTQRNLSVWVEKTQIGPTWFCYANSHVVVQEADRPTATSLMNPAPSIPQVRRRAEGGRVTLERCTACLCDHANIQAPLPPISHLTVRSSGVKPSWLPFRPTLQTTAPASRHRLYIYLPHKVCQGRRAPSHSSLNWDFFSA